MSDAVASFGVHRFLSKPYTSRDLLELVRRVLDETA